MSLNENPGQAIEDILLGKADLGMLSAANPEDILLDWLSAYSNDLDFEHTVDEGIATFIHKYYGNTSLTDVEGYAAAIWRRVCSVIENHTLPIATEMLRKKVKGSSEYLRNIYRGQICSPYNSAIKAIEK
jgi:hypothetical protein